MRAVPGPAHSAPRRRTVATRALRAAPSPKRRHDSGLGATCPAAQHGSRGLIPTRVAGSDLDLTPSTTPSLHTSAADLHPYARIRLEAKARCTATSRGALECRPRWDQPGERNIRRVALLEKGRRAAARCVSFSDRHRTARPPPTTRGRVAQKSARLSHHLRQKRHESAPTLRSVPQPTNRLFAVPPASLRFTSRVAIRGRAMNRLAAVPPASLAQPANQPSVVPAAGLLRSQQPAGAPAKPGH